MSNKPTRAKKQVKAVFRPKIKQTPAQAVANAIADDQDKMAGEIDALKDMIRDLQQAPPPAPPPPPPKNPGSKQDQIDKTLSLRVLTNKSVFEWTTDTNRLSFGSFIHYVSKFALFGSAAYLVTFRLGKCLKLALFSAAAYCAPYAIDTFNRYNNPDTIQLSCFDSVNYHRIAIESISGSTHDDLRPDRNALKDIKHSPKYFNALYTQSSWMGLVARRRLHGSVEISFQSAIAANCKLDSDPGTAYDRIERTASSLHTVNYDRSLVLNHKTIPQDSAMLAYAMFMDAKQKKEVFPFPNAPRSAKPDHTFHVPLLSAIASMKWDLLLSNLPKIVLGSLKCGILILISGCLYQFLQGLLSGMQQPPTPTPATQSQWSEELLSALQSNLQALLIQFTPILQRLSELGLKRILPLLIRLRIRR